MTGTNPITVLVVDGHEVVRTGLRATFDSWDEVGLVAEADSGAAALRCVPELRPDVAVIEFRLDDMRGDDLCRRLLSMRPGLQVIFFSACLTSEAMRIAHEAGAWRCVTKAASVSDLRPAMSELRAGAPRPPMEEPSPLDAGLISVAGNAGLTSRQARVLELAASGLTDREIGREIYLAESTVRFHMQKLKSELNVRNKTELVATAIRRGLVAPVTES